LGRAIWIMCFWTGSDFRWKSFSANFFVDFKLLPTFLEADCFWVFWNFRLLICLAIKAQKCL
jgi:hypothetical protein